MNANKKNKRKLRKKRKKAKKIKTQSLDPKTAKIPGASENTQPRVCKSGPVTTNKKTFSLTGSKHKMTSWMSNLFLLTSSPFAYIRRKFMSLSFDCRALILMAMFFIVVIPSLWCFFNGCTPGDVYNDYYSRSVYRQKLGTKNIYGLDEGRKLIHVKPGVYGHSWELPNKKSSYEELREELSLRRNSADTQEIHYLEDNIIMLGYTTEEAKQTLKNGKPCQLWIFPEMPYKREITADQLVGLSLLRVQSVEKSYYKSGVTMRKKYLIKVK